MAHDIPTAYAVIYACYYHSQSELQKISFIRNILLVRKAKLLHFGERSNVQKMRGNKPENAAHSIQHGNPNNKTLSWLSRLLAILSPE